MSKYGKLSLAALTALVLAGSAFQGASAEPAASAESVPGTAAPAAAPSELRSVSVGNDASGGPVVTLTGSGPLAYTTLELENPQRLVIDLKGTVSRVDHGQVPVDRGGVQRVRAGQFKRSPEPVSRVVIDLDGPVPYHIEAGETDLKIAFGAAGAPDTLAATQPAPTAAPSAGAAPEAPADTRVAETKPDEADPVPAPAAVDVASQPTVATRALAPDAIEKLLRSPSLAAEEPPAGLTAAPTAQGNFETRAIVTDKSSYAGKKISLNLVDTDIKQIFRLFHEISGLNFVLDPAVEGKVTIVLDNVPWDQALDIILKNNGLDKQYENNVIRIAPTQKLAAEAAQRKQLKEAKDLEVEPITITRTLSYAKAEEVEKVIREGGILSTRGKVMVDKRTNALIISDIPKKLQPLDQLISTLDSETPQVMIEARIVETSKSFSQDLGIKWGFNAAADNAHGTSTGLAFPYNASAKYGLNLPGAGTASTLAFSFGNILDSFTLDIALSDLETEGRGRILSSPKIATQNNERAEIEQGVRIPVVSTTATEINVEFVSASLRLAVTPQITADGTVAMDVIVENNSPDFVNRVGDVPPIRTQRAQTKILVADGGTAVIGGIFTINEGQSEVGVPWFRKIPGLGWLFKTRNITNENRELLIFITPKIVKIG
jgi:type IV pilus secretin PilQ/predicted competence protein